MRNKYSKLMICAFALLSIAVVLTFIPFQNSGFSAGITGNSTTGCSCHGSTADSSVTVSIDGLPASGAPGATEGGFDLTVDKGTFSNPGPNSALTGDKEITQTASSALTWTVDWTAPAAGSGKATFNIAGIVVDGDGTTSGDQWNLATIESNDQTLTDLERAIMTLTLPKEIDEDESIEIITELIDADGNPLENLTVDFYRTSTFGYIGIGQNMTDSGGRATINHTVSYVPYNGTMEIMVVFNGTSAYEGTSLASIVVVNAGEAPPPQFDFSFLMMTIIMIVGAVWMVFGYVVLQIVHIWKEGRRR
jgi:hypothetical protein